MMLLFFFLMALALVRASAQHFGTLSEIPSFAWRPIRDQIKRLTAPKWTRNSGSQMLEMEANNKECKRDVYMAEDTSNFIPIARVVKQVPNPPLFSENSSSEWRHGVITPLLLQPQVPAGSVGWDRAVLPSRNL